MLLESVLIWYAYQWSYLYFVFYRTFRVQNSRSATKGTHVESENVAAFTKMVQ